MRRRVIARIAAGAVAGALVALLVCGLYPLTIDDNLSCGGTTARVALDGGWRSDNGELTPDVIREFAENTRRCEDKARRVLLVAALGGAATGAAGAALLRRPGPTRGRLRNRSRW